MDVEKISQKTAKKEKKNDDHETQRMRLSRQVTTIRITRCTILYELSVYLPCITIYAAIQQMSFVFDARDLS